MFPFYSSYHPPNTARYGPVLIKEFHPMTSHRADTALEKKNPSNDVIQSKASAIERRSFLFPLQPIYHISIIQSELN